MSTQLLSYHNKQEIKDKYVLNMEMHISNDELIQGAAGKDGKGCLVWCTLDEYSHKCFSDELGVDLWIPKLLDRLFEGMENKKAKYFSLAILKAIPVGISKLQTDNIRLKILYYILTSILPKKHQLQKEISKIILMFKEIITGVTITPTQWAAAADAARSAARSAAADARSADARSAATAWAAAAWAATAWAATAWSATTDATATAAAWSAATDATAAAWSTTAARQAEFEKIGNKLVELFEAEK